MKSMMLESLENRQLLAGMHDLEASLLITGVSLVASMLIGTAAASPEYCAGNVELCASMGYGPDGQPLTADHSAEPTTVSEPVTTPESTATPEPKESKCPFGF